MARGVQNDPAKQNYEQAVHFLSHHPMFGPLSSRAHFIRSERSTCPDNGWVVVTREGSLYAHPKRRGEVGEWIYVLAHALLHLGFGHFVEKEQPILWNIACDCYITRF